MSAPTKTPRQTAAAKETPPAAAAAPEHALEPDVASDLQEQITGLHTRIDEGQEETKQALGAIVNVLDGIGEKLETLAAAPVVAAESAPVAPEHDPDAVELPQLDEGTTRFFSPAASDYQLQMTPKRFITTAAGVHEVIMPRWIQFQHHIFTTSDEEEIACLRELAARPGFHDFFEDPLARPVSKVKVVDGPTDTGNRAQRMPVIPGAPTPARV